MIGPTEVTCNIATTLDALIADFAKTKHAWPSPWSGQLAFLAANSSIIAAARMRPSWLLSLSLITAQ